MDLQKYWEEKQKYYANADWIDKPSIFAKTVEQYFPKTGSVLDLGAGQGQDSRYLFSKGYDVTWSDFSYEARKQAEIKAKCDQAKLKFEMIDLAEGKLPYDDETFSIVYSNLSLHYFSSEITKQLFREIHRVLKKGGVMAMLANSAEDPETQEYKSIGDGLYENEHGLIKRYFSILELKKLSEGLFEPLLLDGEGKMYHKHKFQMLVRFIGKKI